MKAFFEKVLPGDRHKPPTYKWIFLNLAIYYPVSIVILLVTMWIPATDTGKFGRE
jgi:hypothetical protein